MSGTGEKPSTTKTPADFLKSIRGRPVVVKLNSGVDYRGIFHYFLHFPCSFFSVFLLNYEMLDIAVVNLCASIF